MGRSEERTLSRSEAAVLQIHPHSNGGVQVVGLGERGTYSVNGVQSRGGLGLIAAGENSCPKITMSIENGRISTSGPGDEEGWTVYLLIRAPKSASIDMEISLFFHKITLYLPP